MITGVQDVYHEVQDMRRALAFYRDLLGLRVTDESEDWSAFDVGGVRVGLDSTEGKPTPKRAILTFKTTDIRADVKRLRAEGVKFVSEIGDYPWGSVVVFGDSEGNLLKLMQPLKEPKPLPPSTRETRNPGPRFLRRRRHEGLGRRRRGA